MVHFIDDDFLSDNRTLKRVGSGEFRLSSSAVGKSAL
jgi:hypothetical protein